MFIYTNKNTVFSVGHRRSKSIILEMKALSMYKASSIFYLSANGVWLIDIALWEYIDSQNN